MQVIVLKNISRSMLLRCLLLMATAGLLLNPVSAAVALLFNQWLIKTEAVIAASFIGPLLVLLWLFGALWPRSLRWFLVYLSISLLLCLPWWL